MTWFLTVTVVLRILLVLVGVGISYLLLIRSLRNGPLEHALVDYVFANTFAMTWYVIANIEFWFWQSQLMQTFGLIVWIPMLGAHVRLALVLVRERGAPRRRRR